MARDLSPEMGVKVGQIKVPDAFVKAWPHCLMYLILLADSQVVEADRHLEKAKDLTERGMVEIQQATAETPLVARETALPISVLTLLTSRLLQDVTNGQPNIRDTYWEYFRMLVRPIVHKVTAL